MARKEANPKNRQHPANSTSKQVLTTPRLFRLGTLQDLTTGMAGLRADGGSGMSKL